MFMFHKKLAMLHNMYKCILTLSHFPAKMMQKKSFWSFLVKLQISFGVNKNLYKKRAKMFIPIVTRKQREMPANEWLALHTKRWSKVPK